MSSTETDSDLIRYFEQVAAIELPASLRLVRIGTLFLQRIKTAVVNHGNGNWREIFTETFKVGFREVSNKLAAAVIRTLDACLETDQAKKTFVLQITNRLFDPWPSNSQQICWTACESALLTKAIEIELDRDAHDVIYEKWWPQAFTPEQKAEMEREGAASSEEILEGLSDALLALSRTPSFRQLCRHLGLEDLDGTLGPVPVEPDVDLPESPL